MRAHIHTRATALISALLLVLVLSTLVTATALAAPPLAQLKHTHDGSTAPFVAFGPAPGPAGGILGGPLRERGAPIGRYVLASGGAPVTGAPPWIIGGLLAALLVGGTAAVATTSRRPQARLAGVSELPPPGAVGRTSDSEGSRRKAA